MCFRPWPKSTRRSLRSRSNAPSTLSTICVRLRATCGRDLVWTLEKIAFRSDSFEDGALLLLRLALAENETWGNNATGQFKALFPLLLADTAADGVARLSLLDEVARTTNPNQLAIVVDALIDASSVDHFSRFVGSEIHGSRPAVASWHPATREEAESYVTECVTRLAAFAKRDDALGKAAPNRACPEPARIARKGPHRCRGLCRSASARRARCLA